MRRVLILFVFILCSCAEIDKDREAFFSIVKEFETQSKVECTSIEEIDRRIKVLKSFENKGNSGLRLRALFLEGSYLLAEGKDRDALMCFVKASHLQSFKVEDIKYLGLLNAEVSKLLAEESKDKSIYYKYLSDIYLESVGFKYLNDNISFYPGQFLLGSAKDIDYYHKTNYSNTIRSLSRKRLLFVICIVLIIVLSTSIISRYWRRIQNDENKIKGLKRDYNKYKESASLLIDYLMAILETAHIAIKEKRSLEERLFSVLDVTNEDSKGRMLLEKAINARKGNIVLRFKKDFPNLTEKDYMFFCFSVVGFDASAISVLMDLPSKGAVYTRKFRLKQEVIKSEISNKNEYLESLT